MTTDREALDPCPFCGHEAEIERIGDARQSTIYACTFCGCRLETGEEWGHGRQWNARTSPEATEWRPIASAPRDGTAIRLMRMEDGEPETIAVMQWGTIQRNGLFPGQVGMWVAPDGTFTWQTGDHGPTHWQPSPHPRRTHMTAPAKMDLKPCPFCGQAAHLDTYGKGGWRGAAVFCADNTCPGVAHGSGGNMEMMRASAVKGWNTRAPTMAAEIATLTARVAELEAGIAAKDAALRLADEIAGTLVRSRRSHGYVIATVLPLDTALNEFLRTRAAAQALGDQT